MAYNKGEQMLYGKDSQGNAQKVGVYNQNDYNMYSKAGFSETDPMAVAKSTGASAGANASVTIKPTPTPTTAPTPSPVVTSTAARNAETDNGKGYVSFAGEDKVFEKATKRYVPYEEAVSKNIWNDVQKSTEARPADYTSPTENIQKVFGADWKPSPAITPELQAKGIMGAVKIGNQVYTIGTGGHAVGTEEYKQLFGTEDQNGIVGQIDLTQAVGLGITPTQNDISSFNEKMAEDMYSVNSLGELSTKSEDIQKKAYAEADKTQKEIKDSYTKVISLYENFQTEKTKAKNAESEKLGIEEKSKAISEAQTVCNNLQGKYLSYINGLVNSGISAASVSGAQAQARAQMAIELAPLQTAVTISQGNYDRAKTMLDEFSADYNTSFEMLLNGYQANIDMLGSELSYEQNKAKTEAESKLALLSQSYNEMRTTQEEVKKLAMIYNAQGANITISDNWETALKKANPFIKSEADFEKQVNDLDLQLKKAQIAATGRSNRSSTPAFDSGIDGIDNSKQLTAFQASVKVAQGNLESGQNWGDVWDNVKKQFPNVSNEVIDAYLGGSVTDNTSPNVNKLSFDENGNATQNDYQYSGWATPGYYETWKQKQSTATTVVDPIEQMAMDAVKEAMANKDNG